MRKTIRTALAATAVVGLLAIPAAGATANSNSVSFTVAESSGSLSVLNNGDAVTLAESGSNPVFDAANLQTVTGTLPSTTILDQRGGLVDPWTVSVASSGDWLNQTDNSVTVPASGAHVYFDAATVAALETTLGVVTGGMLLTDAELVAEANRLDSSYTLIAGTTTLGDGTFSYAPAVSIAVPAGTPAGVYTATVTQSIS